MNERIIGEYIGQQTGPLVICLGGVHGNEPAGVRALEMLMERLRQEPEKNPGFQFHGILIALRANLSALAAGQRYLKEDLNRAWSRQRVERLGKLPAENLQFEEKEMVELLFSLENLTKRHRPENIVFIDLHTNSAQGGIFGLPATDALSQRIAAGLHAPVVKGMLEAVNGSMLEYLLSHPWGVPASGLAFEAGQHEDPESVRRALAAAINCLRSVGCVQAHDVDNEHDQLLISFSKGLPATNEIIWRHHIEPQDAFRMEPGFRNFDPIRKGQLLAHDRNGPIYAQADGHILMPLYQTQGEDGFFLIRASSEAAPTRGYTPLQ